MNPTFDQHDPETCDDPRLLRATKEYLAELEAGRRPERAVFLSRFPGLAEVLGPYLDALDLVHGAAPLLDVSPSSGQSMPRGPEPIPAEPLGDFRIVREIGRGGMGVVYEAVQRSLGRRVALKVLSFAAALDGRQLQRFKQEAMAAAHLHHTNIVPVHAVGEERGVHYYAMQLIEGQNLAALVEELRAERDATAGRETPRPGERETQRGRAASGHGLGSRSGMVESLSLQRTGSPAASFRTATRLVQQAAEALEYAHQQGVVHRDVKPANLLVDGRGNVWVTDFGLALFHADAGLTQSGDLLGTLRYMSPEQAGGSRALVDHRTDVYSLGATLYELLTLTPLFAGPDRQSLLHQILNDDPVPPRNLDRSIPPELETIVLKALGKTPAERYATARELSDDLQRFLEDRPIKARRPTVFEKATKWARRHRAVVGSAVAALVLLVAGLSVATALIARAYDRERLKVQEAAEQRAQAEESFRQARAAVDELARIGEEELAGKPFAEQSRRRLLEAALAYYQAFLKQHGDDPTIQKDLEGSRDKVEAILRELTVLMGAREYVHLHNQAVQDELRLSDGQRSTLAAIDRKWHDLMPHLPEVGPAEAEKRCLALAQEQEAEVARLLSPAQLRRFKQIALQAQGPAAFRDPDVIAQLKLTAVQRERLRAIEDTMGEGPAQFRPGPPPGGPKGGRRGMGPGVPGRGPDDMKKAALERALAMLTPEQQAQWRELAGAPFDLSAFCGPGPFGHRHEGGRPPDWPERKP